MLNRIAGHVETYLDVIQEFMQAAIDNFANLNVVEFGADTAQMLLGRIAESAYGRARNGVQGSLCSNNAIVNCAGKFTVKNKELNNPVRRDLLKSFAIHLECARRAENSGPHEIVIGSADGIERRQQQVIFRIQDPRRLVRAFDQAAEPAEVPAFVV